MDFEIVRIFLEKQLMKLISITFVILALAGCRSNQSVPSTFYFKLYNDIDSYDSRSGEFKRAGSGKTLIDTTVQADLTQQERQFIYEYMIAQKADELPADFPCTPTSNGVIPAITVTLEFTMNEGAKKSIYSYGCTDKVDSSAAKRFINITSKITAIIVSKPSIKAVPESGIVLE